MPLYPGPWQSPPGSLTSALDATAAGTVTYDSVVMGYSAPPFSNLCEPTAPVDGTLSFDYMTLTETELGQLGVDFNLSGPLGGPGWSPPLPWPTGAASWEFDFTAAPAGAFQPWAHYLDGITVTVPLEDVATHGSPDLPATDTTVIAVPVPTSWPSYTTGDMPHGGADGVPGSMLTINVGSAAFPAATMTGTLTTSLIDPSFVHDLLATSASAAALRLAVAYDNQRSHTGPASGTWRRIHVSGLAQAIAHFTAPRWRFLFSRPLPLRQFPRDDYLGSAPRQGRVNQPKSVQASSRQGWVGTYR